MSNIFIEQPEFLNSDPRINRPKIAGYSLNAELMLNKQSLLLPKELIINKRILDLGSSNAGSGAWCLSNGASYYKGVELMEDFITTSTAALSKYYKNDTWDIVKSSIEDFLSSNKETFDVVIAAGIFHAFADPMSILKKIAQLAPVIVIESAHPTTLRKTKYLSESIKTDLLKSDDYHSFIENEPFIEVGVQGMSLHGEKTLLFNSTKISMGALKHIMASQGFVYENAMNLELKKRIPDIFSPYGRFACLFIKQSQADLGNYGFSFALEGKAKASIYNWNNQITS